MTGWEQIHVPVWWQFPKVFIVAAKGVMSKGT